MKRIFLMVLILVGCQAETHEEHKTHDEHEGHDDHDDEGHDDDHGEEKGGEDEEGVVHLSPEALARSGIRSSTVANGTLTGTISVPAEVQLNPDRVAHISPLVGGQLLSVDVTIGDQVTAGQQLGILRSVDLGQARVELNRTASLLRVAKKTLKRQERLRKEGINSERSLLKARQAFEQAKAERDAARSRLQVFGVQGGRGSDMALQSQIAGLVIERHATRGENVSPDDTLFIIADLSRVWVIGRVYERQVAEVRKGMRAMLSLSAYPTRTWTGTIDFVGATLDEATRTLPIRVEIDNPDGLLRPGLFGTLQLSPDAAKGSAVLVPLTAVQMMDKQAVVFVPGDEPGEFASRPITLGRSESQHVEVLQGLKSGAEVVVSGGFILKSELMRSELGHGHAH